MTTSSSSRYSTPQGPEAEFEPGSRGRVLQNLCRITRKREMDKAEYEALLGAQERALSLIGPETRFTAALICEMHRDWLGGLYAWAGRYRTVELQKGGFRWPPAFRVAANMDAMEKNLLARHTPCRAVIKQSDPA
jgi:cell filamentation protein